jgi:lipopolysaccharide export system protein LptA
MKKIIFLMLAGAGGLALAQTNAPAPKTSPHQPTVITAASADFDLNIKRATYRGHVLVEDPKVKMQCELLVVDLPANGEHLQHVNADTNVVIDFTDEKGVTYHVTSARAVYAYSLAGAKTNETVTFTGNPKVESAESTILSEPLVWDKAANHFIFTNPNMKFRQNLNGLGAGTNAPPLKFY